MKIRNEMKKHIINGHEMATLRVPDSCVLLLDAVAPYVNNVRLASLSKFGECYATKNGHVVFGTFVNGGNRLQNSRGKQVPYAGQEFLLTVPVFCLSEKGLAAAKKYEDSQQ